MNVKETIIEFHPNSKDIAISSPVAPTDQKETNDILKNNNNILKQKERNVIFHNISETHLHRDGLHKFKWYNYTSWKSFIKDRYVFT